MFQLHISCCVMYNKQVNFCVKKTKQKTSDFQPYTGLSTRTMASIGVRVFLMQTPSLVWGQVRSDEMIHTCWFHFLLFLRMLGTTGTFDKHPGPDVSCRVGAAMKLMWLSYRKWFFQLSQGVKRKLQNKTSRLFCQLIVSKNLPQLSWSCHSWRSLPALLFYQYAAPSLLLHLSKNTPTQSHLLYNELQCQLW